MRQNLIATIEGGQIPSGEVKVSGAKNAATRILAASIISDEEVILENFPTELVDANYKIEFIRQIGGNVIVDNVNETIRISTNDLKDLILEDYNFPIRTTYLLVPGLIKKTGVAKIPYPGGCKIGNRGYDLHIMVWEKLGATVEEKDNYIEVHTTSGLVGSEINFPISTIGGTESALICGSIAKGKTIIKNAYISPEVDNLISFLRGMGVKITVIGNSYIEVFGLTEHKGSIFKIMPDRIEALTWIVYGALSKGDILVKNVPFESMEIPLTHLLDSGIDFYRNSNNIRISPDSISNHVIQPFELATGTHPGVISDMQPFYVLLGLYAQGISRIFDYRYPERLKYCEELTKFYPGMIEWESGKITTRGLSNFTPKGVEAESTDLRGSMAVVIAGLLSEGITKVNNVEMALRGYNKLEEKLENLGVRITID